MPKPYVYTERHNITASYLNLGKKRKNTGRGDLAPITDTFLPDCLIGLSQGCCPHSLAEKE
jgi:hypothetical protein